MDIPVKSDGLRSKSAFVRVSVVNMLVSFSSFPLEIFNTNLLDTGYEL